MPTINQVAKLTGGVLECVRRLLLPVTRGINLSNRPPLLLARRQKTQFERLEIYYRSGRH